MHCIDIGYSTIILLIRKYMEVFTANQALPSESETTKIARGWLGWVTVELDDWLSRLLVCTTRTSTAL